MTQMKQFDIIFKNWFYGFVYKFLIQNPITVKFWAKCVLSTWARKCLLNGLKETFEFLVLMYGPRPGDLGPYVPGPYGPGPF